MRLRSSKIQPMDTNTRITLDALMVQLKAGDQSVIPTIIETYNNRPDCQRFTDTRIMGWQVVEAATHSERIGISQD